MIVIFGKGKVGNGLVHLANSIELDHVFMDDADRSDEVLTEANKIVITPGIPPSHKVYQQYGNKIQGELDFVFEVLRVKNVLSRIHWVGVTGTDGKSTVTWILYSLFINIEPESHVYLTGNFDTPVGEIAATILEQPDDGKKIIMIVELSSFMLYNMKKLHFDYSIWTNLSMDHLNWHTDMADYTKSKLNLFEHTTKHKYTTYSVFELLPEDVKENLMIYDSSYDLTHTHFVGKHNSANLKACYELLKQYIQDNNLDVSDQILDDIIRCLKPLHHRMDCIQEIDGIKVYDDGKSTTSNSLKAALESFNEPLILIAGGSDKGDQFWYLGELFEHRVGFGVFLGTTAPQFAELCDRYALPYVIVGSMKEAVQKAFEAAQGGFAKKIVFSPGCASFDMFKNWEDRVNQFLEAVEKITH